MQFLSRLALAAALSMATLSAQAALVARPNGMVYDDVQNITWLQNWNMNGLMNWATAGAWANNLVHGGFSDWRLPTTLQPDATCSDQDVALPPYGVQSSGINCRGSEMGYMFYAYLGGKALQSVLNSTGDTQQEIDNLALFTNVQADDYWSGTAFAPATSFLAWSFDYENGTQDRDSLLNPYYAVAVRPGDVGAAAVPEPQTLALVMLALGAAAVARRRRPR